MIVPFDSPIASSLRAYPSLEVSRTFLSLILPTPPRAVRSMTRSPGHRIHWPPSCISWGREAARAHGDTTQGHHHRGRSGRVHRAHLFRACKPGAAPVHGPAGGWAADADDLRRELSRVRGRRHGPRSDG